MGSLVPGLGLDGYGVFPGVVGRVELRVARHDISPPWSSEHGGSGICRTKACRVTKLTRLTRPTAAIPPTNYGMGADSSSDTFRNRAYRWKRPFHVPDVPPE